MLAKHILPFVKRKSVQTYPLIPSQFVLEVEIGLVDLIEQLQLHVDT